MWRHVAVELAATNTVIVPDLRGYGSSGKPEATTADTYAKRTMAADVVTLARTLGHDRFALVGHDRGALVGVRAGLDQDRKSTRLNSSHVAISYAVFCLKKKKKNKRKNTNSRNRI